MQLQLLSPDNLREEKPERLRTSRLLRQPGSAPCRDRGRRQSIANNTNAMVNRPYPMIRPISHAFTDGGIPAIRSARLITANSAGIERPDDDQRVPGPVV